MNQLYLGLYMSYFLSSFDSLLIGEARLEKFGMYILWKESKSYKFSTSVTGLGYLLNFTRDLDKTKQVFDCQQIP